MAFDYSAVFATKKDARLEVNGRYISKGTTWKMIRVGIGPCDGYIPLGEDPLAIRASGEGPRRLRALKR